LAAHFDAARRYPARPSDALMARVLADACAAQPATRPSRRPAAWPVQLFRALGGWPAVAGLSAATLAGIWLGISPPAPLAAVAAPLLGDPGGVYLVDLAPGATFELAQEGR
jgi:hypothetical protein